MPRIPDAYTDTTPAAVEFEHRLYVAFKHRDSGRIWLAWTDRPEDEASWEKEELTFGFSGDGPAQIRTSHGPALSVAHGRLWLTFKGHNNTYIWVISKGESRWRGHGHLLNARTDLAPAMSGTMVVHRGHEGDHSIWYTAHSVRPPPADTQIPDTRSNSSPSIADWGVHHRPTIAYCRNHIMVTHRMHSPRLGWGWATPQPIRGTRSSTTPALAMHGDLMYLAYKDAYGVLIRFATYNGRSWILHGVLRDYTSDQGPALTSFGQSLYLIYKEAVTGEVTYGPVPIPTLDPLTVMTLNVRIHPKDIWRRGDDPPHHWRDRLPRVDAMLRSYEAGRGPHIIGMQEVRRRQFPDLCDYLGHDYHCWWEPRGGWPHRNRDEGMALFYRRDRIELVGDERGERTIFPRERRLRGRCDFTHGRGERRNIIWARLRDITTRRTFYVYNTHFGGGDCEKVGQALIAGELIARRVHTTDSVILMGDFNTGLNPELDEEVEGPFRTLRGVTRLENSYRRIHSSRPGEHIATGSGGSGVYDNRRIGRMIDFVLVSRSFQVFDADIDRTMFNQAGDLAIVPCREVDPDGICIDTGGMSDYSRMYSDHWAVWTSLVWLPD